ncbi:YuzF family protein [Bacillus kexueae]|uniref:YuzF family protein n=1 Tax=Aeribacillus kexueae TaxID=2078952 RepID=UPI001FAFF02E|nr:YuzF family protein [Bacillus kexueae]
MSNQSIFYSLYDHYLYQSLNSMTGRKITVQTTQGTIRGKLQTVMPDHIVVEMNSTPFFVRMQQVVWVFPVHEANG